MESNYWARFEEQLDAAEQSAHHSSCSQEYGHQADGLTQTDTVKYRSKSKCHAQLDSGGRLNRLCLVGKGAFRILGVDDVILTAEMGRIYWL